MKKVVVLIAIIAVIVAIVALAINNNQVENNGGQNITEAELANAVKPIEQMVDLNNPNGAYPVSFKGTDIYETDEGYAVIDMKLYAYEMFDLVDVSMLEKGSVIIINKKPVKINTIERVNAVVKINGGFGTDGGYSLVTDESTVYFEAIDNGMKRYYELGTSTVKLGQDLIFYDKSNPTNPDVKWYPGDLLVEAEAKNIVCTPNDTTAVIDENGFLVEMEKK